QNTKRPRPRRGRPLGPSRRQTGEGRGSISATRERKYKRSGISKQPIRSQTRYRHPLAMIRCATGNQGTGRTGSNGHPKAAAEGTREVTLEGGADDDDA